MENFGRNVRFVPKAVVRPKNQPEVLACLDRYRGHRIRAIGRLHSSSGVLACDDVVLDLGDLRRITIGEQDGVVYADVDAGCTVGAVLDYLETHGGFTLPTIGMILSQSFAGAIATATHGSGRSSLSHYVRVVRSAAYDAHGKACVYEWTHGDELLAARCGLGCTGIVVSIRVSVERNDPVEEHARWFDSLDEVLAQSAAWPLQQFYLVPWSWCWFAQLRRVRPVRVVAAARCLALSARAYRRAAFDVGINGTLRVLSGRLGWSRGVRAVHRRVFPLLARSGIAVVDSARHVLTMRHDYFVHLEMELFVPACHLEHAARFLEWVLRWCGGDSTDLPETLKDDDFGCDVLHAVRGLRATYVHDHIVTFRRVLPDDTLISMTGGGDAEARYAVSLVTYQDNRAPFLAMSSFVAHAMAVAYRARPHWGKVCPLGIETIQTLYPTLDRFRAVCLAIDPDGTFVNAFARGTLAL